MPDYKIGENPEETLRINTQKPQDFFELFYEHGYPSSGDKCCIPAQEVHGEPLARTYMLMGMARLGSWYTGTRRSSTLSQWLMIHWPSLIREAYHSFETFPLAPWLLWCFKDLFVRRSYYMAELLERCLLAYTRRRFHASIEYKGMPMSDIEAHVLQEWLSQLAREPRFIAALKDAFDTLVMGKVCVEGSAQSSRLTAMAEKIPSLKLDRVSLVAMYYIPTRCTTLAPTFATLPLEAGLFGPAPIDTLAHEIFLAARMFPISIRDNPESTPGFFGVMRTNEPFAGETEGRNILTINFARFYRYRKEFDTERRYYHHVFRRLRYQSIPEIEQPGHIVAHVQAKYLRLHARDVSLAMRDKYYGVGKGKIWPEDDWKSSVFLDCSAIDDLWRQCYRRELAADQPSTIKEPIVRVPRVHLRAFAEHSFRVIKHQGKFWFSPLPPLTMLTQDKGMETRRYKGSTRMVAGTGAYYNKTLNLWFYSARRLVSTESFAEWNIPGLQGWLDNMAHLSTKQFAKTDPAYDTLRRGRTPFSLTEDNALQRYYRPGMTEDECILLMDACPTRSPAALSMRAHVLCDQLIESGVYELNKLPHRVYNARLGRRIAAAKAAAKEKSK